MSIEVETESMNGKTKTLEVKTYSGPVISQSGGVILTPEKGRALELSTEAFCEIAAYVFENTDVQGPNDARIALIRKIRKGRFGAGYNPGNKRFVLAQWRFPPENPEDFSCAFFKNGCNRTMLDVQMPPEVPHVQTAPSVVNPLVVSIPAAVSGKTSAVLASNGISKLVERLGPENFRIPVTSEWKRKTDSDEGTEYLENPSGDVWMVEGTGEQYFTPESALRETLKTGCRIPTSEEWNAMARSINSKIDLERGMQKDASVRERLSLRLAGVLSALSAPSRMGNMGVYVTASEPWAKIDRLVVVSEDEIHLSSWLKTAKTGKVGYSVRCFKKAD